MDKIRNYSVRFNYKVELGWTENILLNKTFKKIKIIF